MGPCSYAGCVSRCGENGRSFVYELISGNIVKGWVGTIGVFPRQHRGIGGCRRIEGFALAKLSEQNACIDAAH